jgi:hypothetical protein
VCARLAEQRGDAGVHDLLGQHLLLVQVPDELDVAQRAAPRLELRGGRRAVIARLLLPLLRCGNLAVLLVLLTLALALLRCKCKYLLDFARACTPLASVLVLLALALALLARNRAPLQSCTLLAHMLLYPSRDS